MSFPNTKLILLIVGILYLSGCALKASSTSRATTKIDPCSLITSEEAAAALGGNVEVTPKPDDKVCAYSLAVTGSSPSMRHGSVVVGIVTSDSAEFEKFGMAKDPRTAVKPIPGVGDRAVLYMSKERPDEGAKAMQVLKGDLYIGVGMATSTPPVSEDVLKSLAAKALSRLPRAR